MTTTLYILIAMVALGVILRLATHNNNKQNTNTKTQNTNNQPDTCCGRHQTCRLQQQLTQTNNKPLYYDDEELDRYAGKNSTTYNETQIEEFREILYTMNPHEVPQWIQSLQKRNITIPDNLRDEILLIISEQTQNNTP